MSDCWHGFFLTNTLLTLMNTKHLSLCFVAIWCTLTILQAAPNKIIGNKIIVTEEISVANYHEIEIETPVVIIYEQKEEAPYLSITTDQNIIQALDIRTKDNCLRIRKSHKDYHLSPSQLVIRTNSSLLKELSIAGSADVSIQGDLHTPSLDIEIAGSGKVVTKGKLYARSVDVEIAGSGDVYLAGEVEESSFEIAGSGIINAIKCLSTQCEIEIAGSGEVKTNVKEKLECEIAGSGSVLYKGHPRIKASEATMRRIRDINE